MPSGEQREIGRTGKANWNVSTFVERVRAGKGRAERQHPGREAEATGKADSSGSRRSNGFRAMTRPREAEALEAASFGPNGFRRMPE